MNTVLTYDETLMLLKAYAERVSHYSVSFDQPKMIKHILVDLTLRMQELALNIPVNEEDIPF